MARGARPVSLCHVLITEAIPISNESLKAAAAALLRQAPDAWADTPQDSAAALDVLTTAGFVERRLTFRLGLPGLEPKRVGIKVFSGYGFARLLGVVLQDIGIRWGVGRWEKLRQEFGEPVKPFVVLERDEWRITEQGRLARADLERGAVTPIAFALKRRFFDGRMRLLPDGRVVRREPVRGYGRLVSIENAPSGPLNVALSNWDEGAKAFAETFAKIFHQPVAQKPAAADSRPAEEFIFARDGDGWFVRGFGQEGHFKGTIGFEYIYRLLLAPGGTVSMTELVAEGVAPRAAEADMLTIGSGVPAGDEVLDAEAKQDYSRRLKDINAEIDRARRNNDWAALEPLERDRQALLDALAAAVGWGGRGRKLGNVADKLRTRIANALVRAYSMLEKGGLPTVADHFRLAISAQGTTYVYRPDKRPDWVLSGPMTHFRT